MKKILFTWMAILLFAPLAHGQEAVKEKGPLKAKAELKNAKGEKVGEAIFTEVKDGVKISLHVTGLSPGSHGIHIHEVGKCDPPDFKSAGAHFNPYHKEHGFKNPAGAHAGDLPNLVVKADGTAKSTMTAKGVTLKSDENSLLRPGGTALVIHAEKDDEKTNPAGASGGRIVCGVIEME